MVEQLKAAGMWEEAFDELVGKVDPLTGLPFMIDQIRLADLPSKADERDVQKLKLEQEALVKRMTELANSGGSKVEIERCLRELASLRDV
eukprot:SAG11_NODE_34621_length_271_cov_0.546512_1_plen_89_part_11